MKRSALRTWLRRENAREYEGRAVHWLGVFSTCYGVNQRTWLANFDSGYVSHDYVAKLVREPRADLHIHGRDCRWLRAGVRTWVDNRRGIRGHWMASWPDMPVTCGVEGDYP